MTYDTDTRTFVASIGFFAAVSQDADDRTRLKIPRDFVAVVAAIQGQLARELLGTVDGCLHIFGWAWRGATAGQGCLWPRMTR